MRAYSAAVAAARPFEREIANAQFWVYRLPATTATSGNSKGGSCCPETAVQNLLQPFQGGQVDKRSSRRKRVIPPDFAATRALGVKARLDVVQRKGVGVGECSCNTGFAVSREFNSRSLYGTANG